MKKEGFHIIFSLICYSGQYLIFELVYDTIKIILISVIQSN